MKPVPFDYARPATLAEACRILADDADALILAGGQTLIPMLAMRLARPTRLVDISRIDGLAGIDIGPDTVTIGAMARQAALERSRPLADALPLVAAMLPWIGHAPTRTRGTIGGSVANADPAAELPLALVTLDGAIDIAGADTQRTVAARDFFLGPMMTALEPGECIVALSLPRWSAPRTGIGFHEVANRRSDFAMVAAAAQVTLDAQGTCTACTIGIGGVTGTPLALTDAAAALVSGSLADADISTTARAAVAGLDAMSDPHASAAYRKRAAADLITKALVDARDSAGKVATPS